MERIPQRDLRNHVSAVLRRVMAGERLRVTVAGRDAADLVPIEEAPIWTSGSRARTLIAGAQADADLAAELDAAFPDTTDMLWAGLRALLDTSVFIAREQGRPLGPLPDEVAVSVVTISELRYGVLASEDHARRAVRLKTLEAARRLGSPLVIDEAVGDELARLRVALRALGRAMKIMDAWIAATAMSNDAAVCTQDADFDAAHEAGLLQVVRV